MHTDIKMTAASGYSEPAWMFLIAVRQTQEILFPMKWVCLQTQLILTIQKC